MYKSRDAIADGLKSYADPANFVRAMAACYLSADETERTEIAFALLTEIAAMRLLSVAWDEHRP